MLAEIINKPISGQYEEKHFGETSPNCLWVKFSKDPTFFWVGSFQQGTSENKSFILILEKEEKVFVVASGLGYLIDILNKQLLNRKEILAIRSAILNDDSNTIYFSDGYDLKLINSEGVVSVLFEKYYFYEIELIRVEGKKLYTKYWDYQRSKEPFLLEINLETEEIKDSYYDSDKQSISNKTHKTSFIKTLAKLINRQ